MYTAKLNFNAGLITVAKNHYSPERVSCHGKEICIFCKTLSQFFHKLQKHNTQFLDCRNNL